MRLKENTHQRFPTNKIVFIDAPVVASFAFPSALQEGERGSATCTIRSGDRPVEFQWKKDGILLTQSSNVDIQYIKDSSLLLIETVTSKSSGNYTCIVKNSFGQDQFTASLSVTGNCLHYHCINNKLFRIFLSHNIDRIATLYFQKYIK